jgi:DNA-binding LacI/PurR family transcriptional regulator
MSRATSYDVATAAGVAQSTVSRCFRADSNISAETRTKVLEVAERLGYVPNALARSLIMRRSNMVGVIATRFTMRGNPDLIYALGESLSAAGKSLLLVTVENDWPGADALRGALEYPLDGLISCAMLAEPEIASFLRRGVSLLFYNRNVSLPRIDCVKTDNATAAADIARRLHEAGHRNLLCVAGPSDAPVSQERLAGFMAGLTACGVPPPEALHADYSYAGGRAAFLAHIATAPPPDAVFCANDQLALGVLDACRFDLGLAVPADISVVGFDDVPEGARPTYELTTLRQNSVDMAHMAIDLLLRRMQDPKLPARRLIVPATLVARGSARLAA